MCNSFQQVRNALKNVSGTIVSNDQYCVPGESQEIQIYYRVDRLTPETVVAAEMLLPFDQAIRSQMIATTDSHQASLLRRSMGVSDDTRILAVFMRRGPNAKIGSDVWREKIAGFKNERSTQTKYRKKGPREDRRSRRGVHVQKN